MTMILFFLTLIKISSCIDLVKDKTNMRILPFSRIKLKGEDIYFSLGLKEEHWHKLLSIQSVGADAIVEKAKSHYGLNKCDGDIECFKYNIIANFDKVFSLTGENLPTRVSLEYASENPESVNTGVDVESSEEKFKINETNLELDIKLSKEADENLKDLKNLNNISPFIFKGINRLKKAVVNLFSEEEKQPSSSPVDDNLRKELKEMKEELLKIKNEEKIMENSLDSINKKTLLDNLWRREVMAGIFGAFFVFALLFIYYAWNGLFRSPKVVKTIN